MRASFSITEASISNYFLISLNALLVLTRFCNVFTKFLPDNNLLALQEIAKAKKGPILVWVNTKFHLWCPKQPHWWCYPETPQATSNATQSYHREKILPWHQTQAIKKLSSSKTTWSESNENLTKAFPGKEPYSGMFIDISRQVHLQ